MSTFVATPQMWAAGRRVRLGGLVGESCCEVERLERETQRLGETWRVDAPHDWRSPFPGAPLVDAAPELFDLVCVCGSRAALFESDAL